MELHGLLARIGHAHSKPSLAMPTSLLEERPTCHAGEIQPPSLTSGTTAMGVASTGLLSSAVSPSLLVGSPPLPTGVAPLDEALMGGMRAGFVMELAGPPSCGKTTVAMCWVSHAMRQQQKKLTCSSESRPNSRAHTGKRTRAGSAVDDGEGRVGLLWLHTSPEPPFEAVALATSPDPTVQDTAGLSEEDVWFVPVSDVESLRAMLPVVQHHIDESQQRRRGVSSFSASSSEVGTPIRLVVIDNFSELVRRSHSGLDEDALARQEAVAALLNQLKLMAEREKLTVLLLSESAVVQSGEDGEGGGRGGGGRGRTSSGEHSAQLRRSDEAESTATRDRPSLQFQPGEFGRVMYHAVNVRLRLSDCVLRDGSLRRRLALLKSPLSAPFSLFLPALDHHPLRTPTATSYSSLSKEGWTGSEEDDSVAKPEAEEDAYVVTEEGCASMDAWDYTDVPIFLCL